MLYADRETNSSELVLSMHSCPDLLLAPVFLILVFGLYLVLGLHRLLMPAVREREVVLPMWCRDDSCAECSELTGLSVLPAAGKRDAR